MLHLCSLLSHPTANKCAVKPPCWPETLTWDSFVREKYLFLLLKSYCLCFWVFCYNSVNLLCYYDIHGFLPFLFWLQIMKIILIKFLPSYHTICIGLIKIFSSFLLHSFTTLFLSSLFLTSIFLPTGNCPVWCVHSYLSSFRNYIILYEWFLI